MDQRVHSYATWDELLGYCHLSADPVGELVLHVFGAATPERIALSDAVCTALQLTEHWQDVREDLARARVYVPLEDLARHGCTIDDALGEPRRRAAAAGARARGGADGTAVPPGRCRSRRACAAGSGSPSPATPAAGGPRSTRSRSPTTRCSPATRVPHAPAPIGAIVRVLIRAAGG